MFFICYHVSDTIFIHIYIFIEGVDDSKMGNPSSKEINPKKEIQIDSHKKGAHNKPYYTYVLYVHRNIVGIFLYSFRLLYINSCVQNLYMYLTIYTIAPSFIFSKSNSISKHYS